MNKALRARETVPLKKILVSKNLFVWTKAEKFSEFVPEAIVVHKDSVWLVVEDRNDYISIQELMNSSYELTFYKSQISNYFIEIKWREK